MLCHHCEKEIPEGAAVCPLCGEAASAPPGGERVSPEPADETPAVPAQKKRGGRLGLMIGGAAAVLALVILLAVSGAKQKSYAAAEALFDAGGYAQAAAAFDAMGAYRDAPARAALSRQWERYVQAQELSQSSETEALERAEELFISLGSFQDAAESAALCRNTIKYDAATALQQEGRYEEALAAFEALGSFEDAPEHVALCAGALAYAGAEQLLDGGNFYAAYQAFTQLGAFEDAAQRARDCVQSLPVNGEVYHNSAYQGKYTDLTVVNSAYRPMFLKLYAANGELACTFFIHAGQEVTVEVPAGTYTLNQAYGSEWFGPEDMFGDSGEYYKCKFDGSYEFVMENYYSYTISQGSGGDPVTSSGTERGTF